MRLLPLPGVFQPPSDAWLLADYLRRERLAASARVLDLCTGSGVLGITAALAGAAEVTVVDISRRAVFGARLNGLLNGVRVQARRGDLFEPVAGRRFDLILTNPPYLPGDISELPHHGLARAWEGGRSGRELIDRIAARASDHLVPGGELLLVCSSVCGERQLLSVLSAGGLEPRVAVRRRGPLGPRLRARADWLRSQGLLLDGDEEEILVLRGTAPTPAGSASPSQDLRRSTSSPAPSPSRNVRVREGAL